MVMEHLFYNQNIFKVHRCKLSKNLITNYHILQRFDFKGIQDRHVEEHRKQQKDATLWDGDWLAGKQKELNIL
jgi:hypothetical protein